MSKDKVTSQYRRAGKEFLATKHMQMFRRIETPEDMARHNVILHDVLIMMGDEPNRWKIYEQIAGAFLHETPRQKKQKNLLLRFGRMAADRILSIGKG